MEQKTEAVDSITFGTPSKGCAVKCYLNFDTMTDDELKLRSQKARGLWISLGGGQ